MPLKSLSAVVAASSLVASFVWISPSKAIGCYPNLVVSDYRAFTKGGADSQTAMRMALEENANGSTACKLKVNAALIDAGLRPVFFQSTPTRATSSGMSCDDRADAVFYRRYPELRGRKLTRANSSLAREWMDIRNSIC